MLDLDLSTILWEIVNFLIITVILYFLVFKPMTKRAEARAVEKAAAKAELEANRAESAVRIKEINERLINLDKEIQTITDEAYASSQILRDELLAATREEASQIMLDAVHEARKEQLVEIRDNQAALVDTVLSLTKAAMQKLIPAETHEHLLDELTSYIWNLGKDDMQLVQKIRDSLAERNAFVELSLPMAPSQEQYMKLYNTFNALTDADVELEVTEDPSLVAGAKARIGDIVLDNSIAAQIEKMRTEVENNLELRTLGQDD